MATYILEHQGFRSFTDFVESEASISNLVSVNLYWDKVKLMSIVKLVDGNEFVFTFVNMTIQTARSFKNRLFAHLCRVNKNFSVHLK